MKRIDGIVKKLGKKELDINIDILKENGMFMMISNKITHLKIVDQDEVDINCNDCALALICGDIACNVRGKYIKYLKDECE